MRGPIPAARVLNAQKLPSLADPEAAREAVARVAYRFARLGGVDTVRRLRPLARRFFSTLRPPGLAILERNPWVRRRLKLLG
jgi:hypothetical protein